MHSIVGGLRLGSRAIAPALIAVGIAGCSGEATRFNDGSYASSQAPATPVGRVDQQQLPPPQSGYGVNGGYNNGYNTNYNNGYGVNPNGNYGPPNGNYGPPPNGNNYQNQSAAPAPSGGSRGMASYAPPTPDASGASPEYTGSIAGRPAAPIPLAPPQGPPPAPAAVPIAAAGGTPTVHVIAQGDTFYNISRRYSRSVNDIAKANNMELTTPLRIGSRLTIPGAHATQTAQAPNAQSKAAPKLAQAKPLGTPAKHAAATPTPATPAVLSPPASAKPGTTAKQQVADASSNGSGSTGASSSGSSTGAGNSANANANMIAPVGPTLSGTSKPIHDSTPSFRWPVRGRIIEHFGPKGNGQQNDGINLAVPEGTPVKAAEDGVVAYAGNELKGYGNLLLVRHANGYVTAYAHSKELLVKRGEEVKRGQVVAKSGQTGNVDTPQLHFEVRKGQSPLNPIPMLKADTVAAQ